MPQYHTALWQALVACIGETWPEVKTNGLYRSRELARIAWEKKAEAGKLPLCVVDLDPEVSGDYGVVNRVEVVTATLYRIVGPSKVDDTAGLIEDLEALRSVLWPDDRSNPLAFGQIEGYPSISDSLRLPVNSYFLNTAKPFYAGAVIARIIVGEQD